MASPTGVHLVGSIPLTSTEDVFRTLSSTLGQHITTIPDGEVNERDTYIKWQIFKFPPSMIHESLQAFIFQPPLPPRPAVEDVPALLKDLKTGYDDAAIESYQVFKKMRDEGVIPGHVKFQVGIPSPVNGMLPLAQRYKSVAEPFYENAIRNAVRNIQQKILHEDLAIQWDSPSEFAMLEGAYNLPGNEQFEPWFDDVYDGIIERFVRCMKDVDDDVDMGLHLCYGDQGRKHFIEPKDTGLMVKVLRDVVGKVGRRIDWVHMPVPKSRTDAEYYEALRDVKDLVRGGMKLYLGLVHSGDAEGTKKRIEAARSVLGDVPFGVATECGLGRTPREELDGILEISAQVAKPVR